MTIRSYVTFVSIGLWVALLVARLGIPSQVEARPFSRRGIHDDTPRGYPVQQDENPQPEQESGQPVSPQSPQLALIRAATHGKIDDVKQALTQGATVNGRGPGGYTALIVAAFQGQLEIVQYLVAHNANVNARGPRGMTALIAATRRWHGDIVQFLLDHGADVQARTRFQATALLAVLSGDGFVYDPALNVFTHKQEQLTHESLPHVLQLMTLLLDRGVDIHGRNLKGKTALRLAVEAGQRDIVQLLLQRGAQANDMANDGQTALMVARAQNRPDLIHLLQQAGAR